MRAWRAHRAGEPEVVLRLDELPDPVAGPGQVVVDVTAAGLNFADVLLCRGEYQERPELPFTPGLELVGTVGGARVVGTPVVGAGALAERTVASEDALHPVPDGMTDESAAALHVTYQTAYLALHTRAALRADETLLVHAAAGGVGSAAVQLGKAAGARVVGTAGGPDKVKLVEELGADVALDYRADDFVAAVKELTGGRGADVVFDPVGGDVFDRSTKCIAFEGRLLVVGFAGGRIPQARADHVLVKNYSVVGVHWGLYARVRPDVPRRIHDELCTLHADGLVDPLVSQVVPFEDAPAALASLGGRGTYGKVVVQVGPSSR